MLHKNKKSKIKNNTVNKLEDNLQWKTMQQCGGRIGETILHLRKIRNQRQCDTAVRLTYALGNMNRIYTQRNNGVNFLSHKEQESKIKPNLKMIICILKFFQER